MSRESKGIAEPSSGRNAMKRVLTAAALVAAMACSRQEVAEKKDAAAESAKAAVEKVQDAFDASTPTGTGPTPEEIERERRSQEWRKLQSFRAAQARQAAAQPPAASGPALTFMNDPKFAEKLSGADASTFETLPIRVPIKGDVNGPSVLKAQILLDRAGASPGDLDMIFFAEERVAAEG